METHWHLGCEVLWSSVRFFIIIIRTRAEELLKLRKMASTCQVGRGRLLPAVSRSLLPD